MDNFDTNPIAVILHLAAFSSNFPFLTWHEGQLWAVDWDTTPERGQLIGPITREMASAAAQEYWEAVMKYDPAEIPNSEEELRQMLDIAFTGLGADYSEEYPEVWDVNLMFNWNYGLMWVTSDVFFWGTADSEEIVLADFATIQETYREVLALGGDPYASLHSDLSPAGAYAAPRGRVQPTGVHC